MIEQALCCDSTTGMLAPASSIELPQGASSLAAYHHSSSSSSSNPVNAQNAARLEAIKADLAKFEAEIAQWKTVSAKYALPADDTLVVAPPGQQQQQVAAAGKGSARKRKAAALSDSEAMSSSSSSGAAAAPSSATSGASPSASSALVAGGSPSRQHQRQLQHASESSLDPYDTIDDGDDGGLDEETLAKYGLAGSLGSALSDGLDELVSSVSHACAWIDGRLCSWPLFMQQQLTLARSLLPYYSHLPQAHMIKTAVASAVHTITASRRVIASVSTAIRGVAFRGIAGATAPAPAATKALLRNVIATADVAAGSSASAGSASSLTGLSRPAPPLGSDGGAHSATPAKGAGGGTGLSNLANVGSSPASSSSSWGGADGGAGPRMLSRPSVPDETPKILHKIQQRR